MPGWNNGAWRQRVAPLRPFPNSVEPLHIITATKEFETWVGSQISVVRDQLSDKHKMMARDPVQFLRGTFYRWAQSFPKVCPDLAKSPVVLGVGDLHIASFGTWRDGFGRLVCVLSARLRGI